METAPKINTDILRIGGSYYAVKRIESQNIDIDEELRAVYDKRHEQHIKTLNEGVVSNAQEDWEKQINHIESHSNKGTHAIPSNLHNKPVMVFNDNLLELRTIMYAPNRVRVSRSYMHEYREWLPQEALAVLDDTGNDGRFTVHIEPPFAVPMWVGYSKKLNKMYTPRLRTFHTFGGHDVCTSKHKASEFWALDRKSLEIEMNTINTFSPANRTVRLGDRSITLQSIINEESFVSITGREEGIWNASRS